ncbi:MAG: NAD(P)-binding domain-containing protein [candidate division KSB1 bacterium]|nr:NAD(P)-binding domain-containing protein [candidate division KSB1 bacterium]MDZ7303701.1 NAD(P)-binding domain-containing protein [candidate division KSB1 bacterium]MDZ7313163.1 NAD(P)-binding domain-containing protein [candidate division KSB1 bacterium]
MTTFSTISFIGGGRVTWFLLQALKTKQALPKKIIVTDPSEAALAKVRSIAPPMIECHADNSKAVAAELIFLAVHPPAVPSVLQALRGKLVASSMLVSLVPTVTMASLSQQLGGFNRLARMIPNAPSLIHQGYNPVAFAPQIAAVEKTALLGFFRQWGEAPEVDEKKLEAYAILTGMGPTYFWFQWLELQRLGREFGMSEAELSSALPAMLHGAAELLFHSGLPAEQVMDLIPVHPLKNDEETIRQIIAGKLSALHRKLSEATK